MKTLVLKYPLVWLLCAAAIFYFWGLSRHDVVTDESSHIVRGMGMLDFDFGIDQPTPIRWVGEVPWWMKLSFHDHPPLVFLLEYFSTKIFGENQIAGRIVPVIAGLLAIVFLYLVAKALFGARVGLVAASIFAATVNHVWISRIVLLESVAIALILAAVYVFLLSLERRALLPWAGALAGLAFLAKYTAVILLPIFLTILLMRRRDYFFTKEFFFAIILFVVVVSPVIIYNGGLYQTFGHFDFQLSYFLGEHVAAWQDAPGRESIGSLWERVKNYIPALITTNSPLFLLLFVGGLLFVAATSARFPHKVLLTLLFWYAVLILLIGPTYRFLAMLTPWFAIFAALFLVFIHDRFLFRMPAVAAMLFLFLLIGEAAYAYNSVIAVTPKWKAPWAYAGIRSTNHNWGYNQLETFVSEELRGKRPAVAVSFNYPVITKLLEEAVEKDTASGYTPESWAIVYNGNMSVSAQLWTFLRRGVYRGWPVVDAETYRKILAANGADYFKKLGVKKIYFINNTEAILLREVRTRPLTPDGDRMEQELIEKGIAPREIKNLRDEVAFRAYEFSP